MAPSTPQEPSAPRAEPWYHWRRWGFNFLTLSLLAHLIFGVGATYLIVQRYSPRKQAFGHPAPGANAPARALEHKVQMQRKQQTMSAPVAVRRVTTTSPSRVALPSMPTLTQADAAILPVTMAGMGGTGVGLSMGGGGGAGGGGGGGLTLFGLRGVGQGLVGTFYDFKQTKARTPTGINSHQFADAVSAFVQSGWNVNLLSGYFTGPQPLYAQQIFVPSIPASEGPAAFGLEKEVKPSLWVVHYRGTVTPTESGTYHFVGGGDDILMVLFNHRLVLARNWDNPFFGVVRTNWRPQANYEYHYPTQKLSIPNGFARGDAIEVEAGTPYPIEVLIGEEAPPYCFMALLIAKDGDHYENNAQGNPLFPVFRLTNSPLPPPRGGATYAPHAKQDGPVWKLVPSVGSSQSAQ